MAMEARLPPDKHRRALEIVLNLVNKHSIPFYNLEKLLDFLSFCCAVLLLRRPFLCQIFNLLNCKSHHLAHIKITKAAKRDLLWWKIFLTDWHDIAVIRPFARPEVTVHTDASGTKGIGGIWEDRAFSVHINQSHRKKYINWKEMYAILFAVTLWTENWIGCKVKLMCDNSAVVDSINKRSMVGKTVTVLQQILLVAAWHDIELQSEWLSSKDNAVADALSRHQFDRLTVLCEQLGISTILLCNSSHLRNFRQKLLSSFGMVSPQQQGKGTTLPPTATKPTPLFTTSNARIRPQFKASQTGSPKSSLKPRPRPRSITSKACAVITSTQDSTTMLSPIPDLSESSGAENATMATQKERKGFPLRETFSSKSCNKSRVTQKTALTSKQRFVSDSQHSFEQGNSHTTSGRNPHLTSNSPDPQSFSKTTVSSSRFQHPKRTIFGKELKSHLPQHPIHPPALSQLLRPCSTAIQHLPMLHCFPGHWAHSPESTSSKQFTVPYSMRPSTQQVSPVTHYAKEPQYLPS